MRAYGLRGSEWDGKRGRGCSGKISGVTLGGINGQSSVIQLPDTISYGGAESSAWYCISDIVTDGLCE